VGIDECMGLPERTAGIDRIVPVYKSEQNSFGAIPKTSSYTFKCDLSRESPVPRFVYYADRVTLSDIST